jgi:hypothetical protein
MSGPGRRTIAICACVAVAGLVVAGGNFDGDPARPIVGWFMVVPALLIGMVAALLGDRSNASRKASRRGVLQIPRPGYLAIGLSAVLALISLLDLGHKYQPLQCAATEVAPDDAAFIRGALSVDSQETRGFPPGRFCGAYAQVAGKDGSRHQVYLGQRVVLSTKDYLVDLLIVISPIAISVGWRAMRLRRSQHLPPTARAHGI